MGAVVGLLFAAGVLLMWQGLAGPTRGHRESRLSRLVQASGMSGISPAGVLGACLASGVVAALTALVISAAATVALVVGVAAAWSPIVLLRRRAAVRAAALVDGWPDAVDVLVSAVRAGMSLPEALGDLSRRGPESLRPACAAFELDYRATGSFTDALDRLVASLADPVADRVAAALRTARAVGGTDLGRVLRTLSDLLREDARTRGEIRARQASTVTGARLAVAAPWLVLLFMSARPEAIAAFNTPAGLLLLVGAAVTSALAYRLMLRLGRLPTEARILAVGPVPVPAGIR